MGPEPFVSADEAARFLAINCRYVLALARKGIAGAYGLGTGIKTKNLSVPVLGTRGCGCGQKQRSKNAGNARSRIRQSPLKKGVAV